MHLMQEDHHNGKLAPLGFMHTHGITQCQLLYFTADKGDLALRRAYRDPEGPGSRTDYPAGLSIPYAQSIIILCDEHPIAAAQPVVLSGRSFSIGIESLLQG